MRGIIQGNNFNIKVVNSKKILQKLLCGVWGMIYG